MPAGTLTLSLGRQPRKKALVVSHERSGTHFLMNTLAANFGYVARPWINFDFELGLNFHAPSALRAFFRGMDGRPVLNVVKSHHAAGFYSDILNDLLDQFHVFYVVRDPRDVMVSYWRMVRAFSWDEGPKTDTPGEFMRAAPRGAMLRYQKEQASTILLRWRDHVEGWLFALPEQLQPGIITVRYEDLNQDFDQAVRRIGERLGHIPPAPIRPDKSDNVIVPGAGTVGSHRSLFTPKDHEFVEQVAGECMRRIARHFE